jgi:hypothetical protein
METTAKPQAHHSWPQYPLRTLVWLAILGPPLLSLAWWWLAWAWPRFTGDLWTLHHLLIYPAAAVVLVLIGVSIFYYPVALAPRVQLPRWQVVLLWCLEFFALWHWLNFLSLIFGWLLIWGDRHEPPGTLIAWTATFIAAAVAATTSKRLTSDAAGRGYLAIVIASTAILLLFAAPYWLSRWLR